MVSREQNRIMQKEKRHAFTIKKREIPLHLMLLPAVIVVLIFSYIPMAGIVIAFQDFVPAKGLFGDQDWVGLNNFRLLMSLPNSKNVLTNTIIIAFWKIILGLVVPIVVALLLNELKSLKFKKMVQTVIYFPHFLSWIILSAVLIDILAPSTGIVGKMFQILHMNPPFFLGDNSYFRGTMVVSDVWKNFGYGTIVYLATITSIDPSLYEAASIDGAGHFKQIWHITLPGMRTIIVLMTVLSMGNVLNAGFDQIFNMYSPAVYETGDILDTLIYRMGLETSQFGPAAAAGLFKSIISTIFISVSYLVADKCFNYKLF
ncbi:sugar ABC transporter permease [Blautia liquoris]|uniref:Sugar ABC transporter permease n=1 Tax=Blautia liquoris TaxID=2779518 RepID=A0A7M2RED2_9FIRM|nr:sugar ABC transporter permease [Blautia liquoris]